MAQRYPQSAYVGLTKSLQSEWQYLQRVVDGLEAHFQPIEKVLAEKSLAALLVEPPDAVAADRALYGMQVILGGLGVQVPTTFGGLSYKGLKAMTASFPTTLEDGTDINIYRKIYKTKLRWGIIRMFSLPCDIFGTTC